MTAAESMPPGGSHPWLGVNLSWGTPHLGLGYPPRKDMGPVEVLWDGDGVNPPSRKDMGTVEVLWDGDGVAPPLPRVWTDKQTESINFPHPSDAGR